MPTVLTLSRESCEEILDYPVIISEYEDQTEQRRLRAPSSVSGWEIESPNLTQSQAQTYRTFYTTQYGATTEFQFTSPIDGVLYRARFDGPIRIKLKGGVYKCSFKLKNLGVV